MESRPVMAMAALLVALALAGCGVGAPLNSPDGSAPGSVASPAGCPDVDLRLPSGDRLDLTGTWLGNDDAYWSFVQVGECVWATATDRYIADAYIQEYLRGVLQPDFTLPIEFAYAGAFTGYGHATLEIDVQDPNGAETLRLRKVAGCTAAQQPPCPAGETSLQTTVWTRVAARPILPPPTPAP